MDPCLSQEIIDQYARGSCSPTIVAAIEAHVAGCRECRRRIALARAHVSESPDDPAGPPKDASKTPEPRSTPGPDDLATRSMPQFSAPAGDGRDSVSGTSMVFEGYQILDELPQGGQAVVYKALHKATMSKVALKVLLPGLVNSAKARRYFRQEVELAASLDHPNIVAIRDSGISHGQYYFAMNYVHGQPLDRYVQAKVLAIREKMSLFCRICDAVAHAHQRGVIHRDLKPSNILVDERSEPHILDFGLAKTAANLSASADGTVMPTITGQIKGTVAYMSPEQAAGRSDLVDVRTDVYSLGVILYQMCTGKLPYDVLGNIMDALRNIQCEEPLRPRLTISRFDSDVEAIILKCLAKDPEQRYQSAGELRQEVRRWLDGLPIIAKSVSSVYLLRKIVARHRYTAGIVSSVFGIMAGAAGISIYFGVDAHRARQEAQETAERALRMAQEQKIIAQDAARFIADVMMREGRPMDEAPAFLESYAPGPTIRGWLEGPAVSGAPSAKRTDAHTNP